MLLTIVVIVVAVGTLGALALRMMRLRAESRKTAELLDTQAAVARVLASSPTLADATTGLLEAIGKLLRWQLGALWYVKPGAGTMRCADAWAHPALQADEFLARSREAEFHPGEGLPGRVWQSDRAAWVFEVGDDANFPRAAAAARAGVHSAFCFPIHGPSGVLGAIEFFADEKRGPDHHLLNLMETLGVQIGDYIERERAQETVRESEARKTAVVEAALDCIITMDHEGRIVEFNPAAARTFGYTAREAIGEELAALIVPPSLREQHRAGLARYLARREPRMLNRRVELVAMRKDGSEFPVELTITSLPTEPPSFTGYIRDISDRRRADEIQQHLAAIVESSDEAILSKDRQAIVTSWNAGAERLYGYTAEEAVGMPIRQLVPPHRHGEEIEILDKILRGERVDHYESERLRKDGVQVDVSLTVSPLRDAGGEIVGASVIARDITEQKRVRERRAELLRLEQETRRRTQQAERRASFLAQAQALLSSSLDYEQTLRNVAHLVVPRIADWCAIDVLGPRGELERLALVHSDPEKQRLANEIEERYGPRHSADAGPLKAVLSGKSELVPEIRPEMLAEVSVDDEHARLLAQLGMRSGMVVPLLARERALGAITLISAESGLRFDEEDLALAEDLGARAAIAVDNARLYGERSYIASTLQQALMPENLPELPGADVAARYLAAGEVNEVGGDFYDIYRAGDQTWGLAIGDVRGKGPRAAAITALARYTLRTASLTEHAPSRILRVLNEAMLRHRADDRFCTVAYASIRPSNRGGMRLTLGVGGHPLPLILRRDASVERVGTPGTLIGLVADPDITDQTVELEPGDSIVLYTDGVPEARSRGDLYGERRLVELLRSCAGCDASALAERIEADVLDFQDGQNTDDLAVLVLRVSEDRHTDAELAAAELEPTRGAPA